MTDPVKARSELAPLPNAEFVQLDAEHWIPTEQPEAMCRAIEDWIARKGLGKAP
jgi:pimeloyl-ACP methyl ester carboxylesterase